MGSDLRDRPPDLAGPLQGPDGADVGGPGPQPARHGWLVQNPNINGYSGAFGYNLATGVTIVVEATKGETAASDAPAFEIFRKAVAYATPATPINF